jgi:hypothetical protein
MNIDATRCRIFDLIHKHGPLTAMELSMWLDLDVPVVLAIVRHSDWFTKEDGRYCIAYTSPQAARKGK